MKKIVFFNIGYMEFYQGITGRDKISDGGSYVNEEGFGWEIYNFKPFKGFLYGYVQPPRAGGNINISRLGAAASSDTVDDILIIWTAKDPQAGGVFITGWYEHATIYKSYQNPPRGSKRVYQDEKLGYYSKSAVENCRLLKSHYRDQQVPIGKYCMGQANIWYAEDNLSFRQQTLKYIEEVNKDTGNFVRLK